MKTEEWKRYKPREPVSPEVRRARIWIAVAIGIGGGWAMAAASNVVLGVVVGLMIFGFLMIRRGRIERL